MGMFGPPKGPPAPVPPKRRGGNAAPPKKQRPSAADEESRQGLTLVHFSAQLEDLRKHIAPVSAQPKHLRDTSAG